MKKIWIPLNLIQGHHKLFAFVLLLVPMLSVGMGNIPVHAHEKIAEFPFPAAEEALFWGEEEKIISATKYIKRSREAPAIAKDLVPKQSQ